MKICENDFQKEGQQKKKTLTWIFVGILLLASALRLYPLPELTDGSVEFGEGLTMAHASLPLREISAWLPPDQAPLKYYLLHPLLYLGRDEFLLRFPALFFDLASMVLLYLLGRALFDRKTALLACFFMAVSMWHIHYATSARNYPLYAFSAILSTLCLYRAAEGGKIRDWIFYGLSLAFSFYSFYPSLFVLAAQLGWFFIYHGRQRAQVKRLALSLGLFVIATLPLILRLDRAFRYKADFGSGQPRFQGYEIFEMIRDHFGGMVTPYAPAWMVFAACVLCLFCIRTQRSKVILLLNMVLLPTALFFLSYYLFRISIVPRHFLHLYPFFLLLSAAGILSWRPWVARALGVLVFMLPLVSYGFFQAGLIMRERIPSDYLRWGGGLDRVAKLIEKNYGQLDFVVAEDPPVIFGIQYYLDRDNKFPVSLLIKEADKKAYYTYTNPDITLYGIGSDLPILESLAASGRLAVVDFVKNIYQFKNGFEIMNWLKTNAYHVDREHGADVYFISPPKGLDAASAEDSLAVREKLLRGSRVIKQTFYPFQSREKIL